MLSVILLATIGITGVSLLGLGFFLGFSPIVTDYIHEEIKKQTQLQNGTKQWDRWMEIPFPIIFNVYAFNVTNAKEVVEKGAKPIVQQVGPFAYKRYYHKINVTYSKEDDILTYKNHLRMVFDEGLSALSDDTNITVLNLPLQSIYQNNETDETLVTGAAAGAHFAFPNDGIFLTIPAKKYFLEGYDFCDTRLMPPGLETLFLGKMLCEIFKTVSTNNPTVTQFSEKIRFSFFAHKNNNTDNVYKISAGNKNIDTLGEILYWNDTNRMSIWLSDTCNSIKGTDSAIYAPFNSETSTIYSFHTDICKVVTLKPIKRVFYKDIEGILARMSPENFRNREEQSCYCIKKTRNLEGQLECLPDGFADMHNCLHAHIVVSAPHMLWADESYANTVEGLEPSEDRHASYVLLEPNTGTPLQGRKRVQFNMIIRPIDKIPATSSLPRAMVPVIWVEEAFDLPESYVQKVKDDYVNKMTLLDTFTFITIGSGSICLIGSAAYMIFPRF